MNYSQAEKFQGLRAITINFTLKEYILLPDI